MNEDRDDKQPKTPIPGPVGDGFPREKDVSTPPPDSDQAKDKEQHEDKK